MAILKEITGIARWSPRAAFPPSRLLDGPVFACSDGVYLVTDPRHYGDDPVWAIGWAESDYWARRVWSEPAFSGDLNPPSRQCPPPVLDFLKDLAYGAVKQFVRSQPTGPSQPAALEHATYRLNDGAFLYCSINGPKGVTYIYGSSNSVVTEEPVAIEFLLPEAKRGAVGSASLNI
jgi:hypothetical protein